MRSNQQSGVAHDELAPKDLGLGECHSKAVQYAQL
jgi:hypothetical protein